MKLRIKQWVSLQQRTLKTVCRYGLVMFLIVFIPCFAMAQAQMAPVSQSNPDTTHTVLYQGYLTDHNGEALVDGSYEITFRLYDQDQAGQVLWTETRTVDVTGGTFSLHLGQENSLEQVDFSIARFLSLELQGETETAERTRLSAVPFSLLAADVKDGKVVKGINGLTDQVEIVAGEGIAVTEGDDGRLIISARTGLEGAVLDTNLRQGTSGGDDGDPEPYIVFNEILRATPSNSFHEMGANGGLTVENTVAGAANINFIRSSGGLDQSYYRFVNRANGDFNIRDVLNNKSPFKMEFDAEENQLVLDANGNVGIGTEAPAFDLDVVDDIHASDDIFSGSNIEAVNDLIAGDGMGQGDVSVYDQGIPTIMLEGDDGNGGKIILYDETGTGIGVELYNSASNGGQIDVNADNNAAVAQIFASTDHGAIHTRQADGSLLVEMGQFNASTGGKVRVKDENGLSSILQMEADASGSGGYFNVAGTSGSNFLRYQGGTNTLTVGGSSTVNLPSNQIQDVEIEDEPGVANVHAGTIFSLTGNVDIALSRTITAPSPGYVFAISTAQFNLQSSTGIQYGVSDDCDGTPTIPANQDFYLDDGTGDVTSLTATAHGIFFVGSGAKTFCLLVQDFTSGGASMLFDRQLDLIFFPTNYGTIVSNLPGDGVLDANQPVATPINLSAERAQSIADNEARIQAELNEMKARMEALEAAMTAQQSEPAQASPKQYGKEDDNE